MAEIIIPKVRMGSDITLRAKLTDNGVGVDWSGLTNIVAMIYSDAQKAIAGPCAVSIDPDNNLILVCEFGANQPQYGGINSLVVRCEYKGRKKTYDRKAFYIVSRTDDLEGEDIVIEDPVIDVELSVEDVSTSLLDKAIDAALAAAEKALEAAGRAPYIGENGRWFVWDTGREEYVDSGIEATGPTGPAGRDGVDGKDGKDGEPGPSGGFLYPVMRYDADTGVLIISGLAQEVNRIRFDEETGELIIRL